MPFQLDWLVKALRPNVTISTVPTCYPPHPPPHIGITGAMVEIKLGPRVCTAKTLSSEASRSPLKGLFVLMCMHVLPSCTYMHNCLPGVWGCQRGASNPLEMELGMVGNHHMGARNGIQVGSILTLSYLFSTEFLQYILGMAFSSGFRTLS